MAKKICTKHAPHCHCCCCCSVLNVIVKCNSITSSLLTLSLLRIRALNFSNMYTAIVLLASVLGGKYLYMCRVCSSAALRYVTVCCCLNSHTKKHFNRATALVFMILAKMFDQFCSNFNIVILLEHFSIQVLIFQNFIVHWF